MTGEGATVDTVEAVVRRQMGASLGGRRGMVEAGIPGALFTILWLSTKDVTWALVGSLAAAGVALAVRLVQRSTLQYVGNAIFGIGLGFLFIRWAASGAGSESAQALAYFLPGILYNSAYTVVLALTCLVGWPVVGFMVGSVTGELTEWHRDRQVVRLCTWLTWLLVLPCAVRVAVQGPLWLGGTSGALDADLAIAALGVLKIALGWPLQIAALAGMAWLLSRDRIPVEA